MFCSSSPLFRVGFFPPPGSLLPARPASPRPEGPPGRESSSQQPFVGDKASQPHGGPWAHTSPLKESDFFQMLNYEGVLIGWVEIPRRVHLLSSGPTLQCGEMWRRPSVSDGEPCPGNVTFILRCYLVLWVRKWWDLAEESALCGALNHANTKYYFNWLS